MRDYTSTVVKFSSVVLLMAIVSACTSVGAPRQLAEAERGRAFDEQHAAFGQRIALAEAGFTTRVHNLTPYFAR